jgi:transcriptional regulator with XRE-family HTH domain
METEFDPSPHIGTLSGASPDTEERIAPCLLIRARRRELGMSQRELSRRSGMPQPHICLIEAGQSGLLSSCVRLLEAMDATLLFTICKNRPRRQIFEELIAERSAADDRRRETRRLRRLGLRTRSG